MDVWIGRDDERQGPFKEEDVRAWLRAGQLTGNELGWYDGLADWQPLSVLFRDEIPGTPPPPFSTAVQGSPTWPSSSASGALHDYASFRQRFSAQFVDNIVLYFLSTIFEHLLIDPNSQGAEPHYITNNWLAMLLCYVVGWLYFSLCESSAWQATLGKLAVGIRVTDMQGHRISLWRALARYPAKILSELVLMIGFLMVLWTKRKQGLHDMIAHTLVLNGRANRPR